MSESITIEKKIRSLQERHESNCICFANGGTRYFFKLEEVGQKKHTAPGGRVIEFPYNRVHVKIHDGEWREFSTGKSQQGEFICFDNTFDKAKDYDAVKNEIIEKTKTFEEAGITIKRISSDNNRAFCYGLDALGGHHFFWAQLEDSFPNEPGGVRLPGVYVRTPSDNLEEKITRFEIVSKHYESSQGRKHPTWFLQWFGGKLEFILAWFYLKNSLDEDLLKDLKHAKKGIGWLVKLVRNLLVMLLKKMSIYGPVIKILKDVNKLPRKMKNFPAAITTLLDEFEKLPGELEKAVKRLNGASGVIIKAIVGVLKYLPVFGPEIERAAKTTDLPDTYKKLLDNVQELLKNVNTTMPIVVQNLKWYKIGLDTKGTTKDNEGREIIKIKKVLDVGICNPHRYEHYKKDNGAEIQAWIYGQVIEQFKYSKLTYFDFIPPLFFLIGQVVDFLKTLLPNMRVHDGMGYNDGLCNFFILAQVEPNPDYGIQYDYAVLTADEQEAFSERWRFLTPMDKDYKGQIGSLSVFAAIDWYHGNFQQKLKLIYPEELIAGTLFNKDKILQFKKTYQKSLPFDQFDDNSRLAVSRYPMVVSGKDNRLHSISCNWGITDFRWNDRGYPEGHKTYPATVRVRDDATICIFGLFENEVPGYFYQKYLPQSIMKESYADHNYSDHPFTHAWHFVREDVFEVMDRYYNFGIYDAYDDIHNEPGGFHPLRPIREHYAYPGTDDRCQYYRVELNKKHKLTRVKKIIDRGSVVWMPTHKVVNPFFKDYRSPSKRAMYLRMVFKWDAVEEELVAVYAHPRDDDIYADLEHDGTVTEWFPVNQDLTGTWYPENDKKQKMGFKFIERVRDFCPPVVKKAELSYNKANQTVHVGFSNRDTSVRYVTIGAVIPNGNTLVARRISRRYVVQPDDLYKNPGDKKRKKKPQVSLTIPLLTDIGIDDWSTFFQRDSHERYGTSIWFEDMRGHKMTPEMIEIR